MDAAKVDERPVMLPIPSRAHSVSVCFGIEDRRTFNVLALGAVLAGGRVDEDPFGRVARWTGVGIADAGVEYTVAGPPDCEVAA